MEEPILVVEERNRAMGAATKAEIIRFGKFHRIVRVFIVRPAGEGRWELLLQQRAKTPADNGGKFDQSVGGHVNAADESDAGAAIREVADELGLKIPLRELTKIGDFYIERPSGAGRLRRFQRVYVWISPQPDLVVNFDAAEVELVRWRELNEIAGDVQVHPECYTTYFPKSVHMAQAWLSDYDGARTP